MPRIDLPHNKVPGTVNPASADLPLVAGDTANGHEFVSTGLELLLVHNTNVGAQDVTIVAVADSQGRTTDEVKSIAADEWAILGPFKQVAWMQSDGKIYVDIPVDDFELAVIQLIT